MKGCVKKMLNNKQVEKIPSDLSLSYKWEYPDKGAASIIVEGKIRFTPFSHWTTDLRTNEKFHSDDKFRSLCEEIASSK